MKTPRFITVLFAIAFGAVATSAFAQDKADSVPSAPDETVKMVSQMEKEGATLAAPNYKPQSELSVLNTLRKQLKAKGYNAGGWDSKKKRYIEITDYVFPIESLDMSMDEFLRYRTLAFLGALVKANAGLCKALGETASLEITVQSPGTPANREFADPVAKKKAELSTLNKRAADLGVNLDNAEKDSGVSISDRYAAAFDALIKKLDATYDPSKIQDQKDAKVAKLREELVAAKADAAQMAENMKNFEQNYRKHSISSDFNAYFEHAIVGGTCMMMAESIRKRSNMPGYEIQMGIVYVWSPKLELAARGIFNMGENVAKLPLGEKEIEQYLEIFGDLGFPPLFTYTDKQGDRWYLGTGYGDLSVDAESGDDTARLLAYQNCYAGLYLNTKGKEALRLSASHGNLGSFSDSSVAKTIAAGFDKMKVSGASSKLKSDIEWPMHDGKTSPARVYVVGVSANSVVDMMRNEESLAESAAIRYQHDTFVVGREAALKQRVESSKNNPADYQKGVLSANQGMQQQSASKAPEKTVKQDSKDQQSPKIKQVQRVGPLAVPDDF